MNKINLTSEQKENLKHLIVSIIYTGNHHQIEVEQEKYLKKILKIIGAK